MLGEDTLRRYIGAVRPLVDAAEEWDRLLRREQGTGFHISEYAVSGREVRLNRVLADLLTPRGPHGQGGRFLDLFLKMVSPDLPRDAIEQWRVIPNFWTVNGRCIDLVLRRDSIAIGVEWKPWAREGTDQLEDYARDLSSFRESWLVFAPGRKDTTHTTLTPKTVNALGNRLVTFPFERDGNSSRSIIEWLEACSVVCRAANVRQFLLDLISYLDKQFPSSERSTDMTKVAASDMIVKLTKQDGDHIRCAFMIERAAPELRLSIAREFVAKLVEKLERPRTDWSVDKSQYKEFSSEAYEAILYRKNSWPPKWGVALECSTPMQDFWIGYTCPSEGVADGFCARKEDKSAIRNAVEKAIRAACDTITENEWWPAQGQVRDPFWNWSELETFVLLAGHERCEDGELALEAFGRWFFTIGQAAEKTVDSILSERGYGVHGT